MECGAVSLGRNEGGFLVTFAIDPRKTFGRWRGVVNLLAKLEGQDGVLCTVNDQDRRGDMSQFGYRIKLGVNEKT